MLLIKKNLVHLESLNPKPFLVTKRNPPISQGIGRKFPPFSHDVFFSFSIHLFRCDDFLFVHKRSQGKVSSPVVSRGP